MGNLLTKTWEPITNSKGNPQMKPSDNSTSADGSTLMMLVADVALLEDANYKAILEDYKDNEETFKADFGKAWYKLMRGGRDDVCESKSTTYTYNVSAVEEYIAAVLTGA